MAVHIGCGDETKVPGSAPARKRAFANGRVQFANGSKAQEPDAASQRVPAQPQ